MSNSKAALHLQVIERFNFMYTAVRLSGVKVLQSSRVVILIFRARAQGLLTDQPWAKENERLGTRTFLARDRPMLPMSLAETGTVHEHAASVT